MYEEMKAAVLHAPYNIMIEISYEEAAVIKLLVTVF